MMDFVPPGHGESDHDEDPDPDARVWLDPERMADTWVRDTYPGLFQTPPARPDDRTVCGAWGTLVGEALWAIEKMDALPRPTFGALLIDQSLGTAKAVLEDMAIRIEKAREFAWENDGERIPED